MKKAGLLILAVVIAGALVFGLKLRNKNQASRPTTSNSSSTLGTSDDNSASEQAMTDQMSENSITYTDEGFTPSNLSVKAGSKVTITNNSSNALQFDSDPHPEHTDDPELNVGRIEPGSSATITVTVTGTHGYHNHLHEKDTGTLIVE